MLFFESHYPSLSFQQDHFNLFVLFFLGPKPKVSTNAFEDLLGQHTFSKKENDGPKTLGDMKKEIMAECMDPEKLQVN